MAYVKNILATNENYKITQYINSENENNKCVITFGEIDSTIEEEGFGKKLIMSEGIDYIYVAQKRYTQYQFLSAEVFQNMVSDSISGKDVYTYGSSLGGYSAIYYGGIIEANILAMSPRIPAHPEINKLMGKRFRNKGFYHKELNDIKTTSKKVCIFYDKSNYIDNYFINFFLKKAYPNAYYYHVENAGHYTARALLLSKELKNVARDFFSDKELKFTLDSEKIIKWHSEIANKRLNNDKLPHAQENLEVLLTSEKAFDDNVRGLLAKYNYKLNKISKRSRDSSASEQKQYSPSLEAKVNKTNDYIQNQSNVEYSAKKKNILRALLKYIWK